MRTSAKRRRKPAVEWLEGRELLAFTFSPVLEYPLPTAASAPVDVAIGADGAVWITESAGNKIARFDPKTSQFNEYVVPTSNATPYRIVPGGNGDASLYFTERTGGKLGRITTSGAITEAPVTDANDNPIPNSPLVSLTYDPLGSAIYATQSNAQQVGLFTVGDFFEYVPFQPGQYRPTASAPNSENWGVAFDRGLQTTAVYFTERDADKIAVFESDPNNNFVTTEYALAAGSQPLDIVKGPDGAFWFTQFGTSKIGRIDPVTRAITEYATPTANSGPWGITSGNGYLYFTESTANKIGRIELRENDTPAITEYALSAGATPRGITVDDSKQVWFAQEGANTLGLFYGDAPTPAYAFTAAVPLPSGHYYPIGLASSPDGHLYAYMYQTSDQAPSQDGVAVIDVTALTAQEVPLQARGFPPFGAGAIGGGWMAVDTQGRLWLGGSSLGTNVFQVLPQYGIFENIPLTSFASLVRSPDGQSMYGPFFNVNENDTYDGFAKFDLSGRTNLSLPLAFIGNGTFDSSGNLWTIAWDLNVNSVIARTDPGGSTTTFPVKGLNAGLFQPGESITIGPDGNVWFTYNFSVAIGRLIPSTGEVTLFPTDNSGPSGTPLISLVSAPDGNLYFLDTLKNALIRLEPATGTQTPFPIPTSISQQSSFPINTLAVGPDGNLWVSSSDPEKPAVLRFTLPKAAAAPVPTVGSYLDQVHGQLTGSTLSNDRRSTLLSRALGRHGGISAETPLGSLPDSQRSRVLGRLASAVLRSPEYRRAELERLSFSTLRHPADARLLHARAPLGSVRLKLLGSRAYLEARAQGGPDTLVTSLYHDVLGRTPSATESRRWENALAHGGSRIALAKRLTFSPEGLATSVQRSFRQFLGRPAEPNELAAGARLLRRSRSTNALVHALVTSPEFVARLNGHSETRWSDPGQRRSLVP
ncbi:MAG: DUF4214 domain-containing protein [Isosphaeraceae bacterium]